MERFACIEVHMGLFYLRKWSKRLIHVVKQDMLFLRRDVLSRAEPCRSFSHVGDLDVFLRREALRSELAETLRPLSSPEKYHLLVHRGFIFEDMGINAEDLERMLSKKESGSRHHSLILRDHLKDIEHNAAYSKASLACGSRPLRLTTAHFQTKLTGAVFTHSNKSIDTAAFHRLTHVFLLASQPAGKSS